MKGRLTRGRIRTGDVVRLVFVWCACAAVLALADLLLPGLSTDSWWALFATTAVAALAGLLVRPALVVISARLGWVVVVLVGLFGQAAVIYVSFLLVPDVHATFGAAFIASWMVALASLLVTWVATTGSNDAFDATLVRRYRAAEVSDPEVDGVVFVQLDGVPFPVLRWAVQAGAVPTIRRWITSGEYTLNEWTPQLPCTTPASQLGILHGTVAGVPAFRWYDRELGRVVVASRPRDAAVIEERASNGRGLLVDGGLSLSNLFTGDAPRSMLTMSRVSLSRGSTRRASRWPATSPIRAGSGAGSSASSARWSRSGSRPVVRPGATWSRGSSGTGPSPVSARPPTSCSAT